MSSEIKCPKCGSSQITADKKGFSGKKAVAGAVLTGGIGLLAGTLGSNKVIITCLACGNQWKPGEALSQESRNQKLQELTEKYKQQNNLPDSYNVNDVINDVNAKNKPTLIIAIIIIALVFLFFAC